MHLLVVRHGQPIDESETGGEGDPPLSELGLRQAQAIGDYLLTAGDTIDHIVASSMVRAHQTALPLCAHLGMEPELDDRLKESGHGSANRYRRGEENSDWFAKQMKKDNDFIFKPETKDEFFTRIQGAFADIATNNPGKTVAVFCHGMVMSALLCKATGTDDHFAFRASYTGLSRVQASSSGEHLTMRTFNEISHLNDVGGATHM